MPCDKAVGFCIMRKQTYESKLESLFQSPQFLKKEAITDEVILKIEKELKKELLDMNKREEISDQLSSKKTSCVLDAANSLYPNLQFILEEFNSEGNSPFLEFNLQLLSKANRYWDYTEL